MVTQKKPVPLFIILTFVSALVRLLLLRFRSLVQKCLNVKIIQKWLKIKRRLTQKWLEIKSRLVRKCLKIMNRLIRRCLKIKRRLCLKIKSRLIRRCLKIKRRLCLRIKSRQNVWSLKRLDKKAKRNFCQKFPYKMFRDSRGLNCLCYLWIPW